MSVCIQTKFETYNVLNRNSTKLKQIDFVTFFLNKYSILEKTIKKMFGNIKLKEKYIFIHKQTTF